jgi:E3 ubiquitin-protein ligase HERC4
VIVPAAFLAGDRQPRPQPTLIPFFDPSTPSSVETPTAPTGVACGRAHSFVLCTGGICYSFGRNNRGQLGLQYNAVAKRFLLPRRVHVGKVIIAPPPPLPRNPKRPQDRQRWQEPIPQYFMGIVVQVACGAEHTVVVTSSGEVYSVGSNEFGQLGQGGGGGGGDVEVDGEASPSRGTGKAALSADEIALFPGVVAFRRVRVSGRVVMAACGDYFSALLSSMREVFTFGSGSSGQMGNGKLDNEFVPRLVREMSGRQTESICCRSEQVVCLTATGEVFWWGMGLRYRDDSIALDGVKKEHLDKRLEFDATLPEGGPQVLVRVEDRAAPKFKHRVADYYRKRGIYAAGNADGMVQIGKRKKFTDQGGGKMRLRPKARSPVKDAEGDTTDADEEVKTALIRTHQEYVHHRGAFMDMSMGTIATTPMATTLPKDCKIVQLKCGEDFYIAVANGTYPPFSQVVDVRADTDFDVKHEEVIRKFESLRRDMEVEFGDSVMKVLNKGEEASELEVRLKQEREDKQRQLDLESGGDPEMVSLLLQEDPSKAVPELPEFMGWKSVIKAISDSLVLPEEKSRNDGVAKAAAQAVATPRAQPPDHRDGSSVGRGGDGASVGRSAADGASAGRSAADGASVGRGGDASARSGGPRGSARSGGHTGSVTHTGRSARSGDRDSKSESPEKHSVKLEGGGGASPQRAKTVAAIGSITYARNLGCIHMNAGEILRFTVEVRDDCLLLCGHGVGVGTRPNTCRTLTVVRRVTCSARSLVVATTSCWYSCCMRLTTASCSWT